MGSGIPPFEYQWFLFNQTTGWQIVRPYGANASFTWTPGDGDVGTHAVQVWVRAAGSPVAQDSYAGSGFFEVVDTPITATLTTDTPFPHPAGTAIRWTTTANAVAPLEYQFWLYDATQHAWRIVQDFSAAKFLLYRGATGVFTTMRDFARSPSWTWSGPVQNDIYAVAVWIRRQGSNEDHEAWSSTEYFTARSGPIQNLTLTSNQTLPVAAGTPITWTASAAGGMAALEYQFWLFDRQTSTWTLTQPWSSVGTWTWTPAVSEFGTHAIQVWVRSQGSPAVFDAFIGSGYFVVVP